MDPSCAPRRLSIEFLKEPGVPLWRRQELQEVRLLDQLVHRFSFYQPLVRNLNRIGDSDLWRVVIRCVAQQPAVYELVACPPVQLRIGLIDRIKRPAHPVGHLKRALRRVDRHVSVVWRDDHLVAARRLNEDHLVNTLFVFRALQHVVRVAVEHLVYLRIRVAELRVHARVIVPVRLDELESHVERRDDRDVIAELMARDNFRVGRGAREVTGHVQDASRSGAPSNQALSKATSRRS